MGNTKNSELTYLAARTSCKPWGKPEGPVEVTPAILVGYPKMRAFLRWAGSKKQLITKLREYWPGGSTRYIEPFAGSACLFLDLQPNDAVLGDLNWELMCTMRVVRDDVYELLSCLRKLPRGKRAYYRIRRIDAQTLSEVEIAARFIYLNHYCFNGLYRTNRHGQFNVPYGPPKRGTCINEVAITKASSAMQRALLLNKDFEETIDLAQPGDFVYLDPPYVVGTRKIFAEYCPGTFAREDLRRLQSTLFRLDERNVTFVITYADSREARQLLSPWKPRRVRTRRNIAGFSGNRRTTYELLATNIVTGSSLRQ